MFSDTSVAIQRWTRGARAGPTRPTPAPISKTTSVGRIPTVPSSRETVASAMSRNLSSSV